MLHQPTQLGKDGGNSLGLTRQAATSVIVYKLSCVSVRLAAAFDLWRIMCLHWWDDWRSAGVHTPACRGHHGISVEPLVNFPRPQMLRY